jgi:hypothetical protein
MAVGKIVIRNITFNSQFNDVRFTTPLTRRSCPWALRPASMRMPLT